MIRKGRQPKCYLPSKHPMPLWQHIERTCMPHGQVYDYRIFHGYPNLYPFGNIS